MENKVAFHTQHCNGGNFGQDDMPGGGRTKIPPPFDASHQVGIQFFIESSSLGEKVSAEKCCINLRYSVSEFVGGTSCGHLLTSNTF